MTNRNCGERARLGSRRGRRGFSLIEVNLAIVVVAGGLLALFALFPAGLRMSVSAVSDTRQAMFADAVLSSLAGKISALKAEDWFVDRPSTLWNNVKGDLIVNGGTVITDEANNCVIRGKIDDFFDDDIPVRYQLRISRNNSSAANPPGGRHEDELNWSVTVVCTDMPQQTKFQSNNPMYHTDLRYSEKP